MIEVSLEPRQFISQVTRTVSKGVYWELLLGGEAMLYYLLTVAFLNLPCFGGLTKGFFCYVQDSLLDTPWWLLDLMVKALRKDGVCVVPLVNGDITEDMKHISALHFISLVPSSEESRPKLEEAMGEDRGVEALEGGFKALAVTNDASDRAGARDHIDT